jgi:hypothetical protein
MLLRLPTRFNPILAGLNGIGGATVRLIQLVLLMMLADLMLNSLGGMILSLGKRSVSALDLLLKGFLLVRILSIN